MPLFRSKSPKNWYLIELGSSTYIGRLCSKMICGLKVLREPLNFRFKIHTCNPTISIRQYARNIVMFIVFNYQRPVGSMIPLVEPLGQWCRARGEEGWLGLEAQVMECVWFDEQSQSRRYYLECESWKNCTCDQKTSRLKGKTPVHMHAGVFKFICFWQMSSCRHERQHSRLFNTKKPFFLH